MHRHAVHIDLDGHSSPEPHRLCLHGCDWAFYLLAQYLNAISPSVSIKCISAYIYPATAAYLVASSEDALAAQVIDGARTSSLAYLSSLAIRWAGYLYKLAAVDLFLLTYLYIYSFYTKNIIPLYVRDRI